MSALTPEQIAEVLDKHLAWLRGEVSGVRAGLTGADLTGANLARADLAGANLTWADLTRANLARANLTWADLAGANLAWADLAGANLAGANLAGANLAWADLAGANLTRANLGEGWKVESYRDLLWIGPLGSRNDFLMYNVPTGNIRVGCYGSPEPKNLDAFVEAVRKTHGESVYAAEYLATVEYLRALTVARVVHA